MLAHRLINYAVDRLNNQQISGWAFSKLRTNKPVRLQFYLDHSFIGETVADNFRKDLKEQKIHPDGTCGFYFHFPPETDFTTFTNLYIFCGGSKPICTFPAETIPDIFTENLPKILFMHIPKTAGTSFNGFVQQRYPAGTTAIHIESVPASNYPDLIKQRSYLAGHFRIETIKQHFDLNSFSLYTILRQPHRHLHSNFNWLRGIAANPESSAFLKHPDYIQNLGTQLHLQNTNIKHILQSLVAHPKQFELELFDNRQTRHFLDYKPHRVSEKDLEQALENFKLFSEIGLTEQYESFVQRFCTTHELPFIKQATVLNRSKFRPLYDVNEPEMQRLLNPLVRFDLRLYEMAQSLIS